MRAFRTLAALLAVLTLSACGAPANGSASSAPSGSVSSAGTDDDGLAGRLRRIGRQHQVVGVDRPENHVG